MAFCTNCGAKLADDAKFCTECGAKVEPLPSEPVTEPVTTPGVRERRGTGERLYPACERLYLHSAVERLYLYPDRAKHRLFRLILAGNTTQYLFL